MGVVSAVSRSFDRSLGLKRGVQIGVEQRIGLDREELLAVSESVGRHLNLHEGSSEGRHQRSHSGRAGDLALDGT